MNLKNNYHKLIKDIGSKAKLVAVTKNQDVKTIEELYQLGQRDFGENRVEVLQEKSHTLSHYNDIKWHFIGELQSKKVSKLCSIAQLSYIHSISRIKTLQLVMNFFDGNLAQRRNKVPIFLQANIAKELQKSGFESLIELKQAYKLASDHGYPVQGFMGMAPIHTNDYQKSARSSFVSLVEMRNSIDENLDLSMGMSRDYDVALSLGSDWLRVGSSLYS